MTLWGIGETVLVQKHRFEAGSAARCYGDGIMISFINSPSLETYTTGRELFVHANICVQRVFVSLRLVCVCVCVGAVTIWDVFHPLITYMTCQPYILHLPALKSQMKKPRCHLRLTHSFKCVSSPRHNACCSFSLSLFHFYWSKFSRTCFFNNAQNVFLGHWGLSQSSRVMPFEKWEHRVWWTMH